MDEKDLCRIAFETWWETEVYPTEKPTYDDSIDNSNSTWEGWKMAWKIRGDLDRMNRG